MSKYLFRTHMNREEITVLRDGEQCFTAMLEAIEQAEHEILLEMYWFASDSIGRKFASKIIQKAQQGCKVFVLYDAVGSWESDSSMFEDMKRAGCFVEQYHPIAPWRQRFHLSNLNIRNHRKLLVVDGTVALTGGLNIGNPWLSKEQGGGGWRDDMIRTEGLTATKLRASFISVWKSCILDSFPAKLLPGQKSLSKPLPHFSDQNLPTHPSIEVLENRKRKTRKKIRKAYMRRIQMAERRIYITNSYFVPDRALRRALIRAVHRGVDVRILLPGISDVKAVQFASRRFYTALIEKGIRIYEWHQTVLHSKTAVIDDWFTVGSYNLDWRSWFYNLELNLAVFDSVLSDTVASQFNADCQSSKRIVLADWKKRSFFSKLFEHFFFLFRRLL